MSVAPHLGHWLVPSLSSLASVSRATGSGFNSSSRIGAGTALLYGSIPTSPGCGGTSCGEPGPVNFGGELSLDMFAARLETQCLGLQRVVVGLRDQPEVEHLLGLLELGDRIVGRG